MTAELSADKNCNHISNRVKIIFFLNDWSFKESHRSELDELGNTVIRQQNDMK